MTKVKKTLEQRILEAEDRDRLRALTYDCLWNSKKCKAAIIALESILTGREQQNGSTE